MATQDFPVEAGHVMMFARAIGDTNPAYDPTSVGPDVVAPPTFVAAAAHYDPDYPLRPRPGEPWMGSGSSPSGTGGLPAGGGDGSGEGGGEAGQDGGTTMHAEQHYTYHRPLRAGDVLSPQLRPGQEWTKEGKRGGVLRFSSFEIDYRDPAGELVVTSRTVSVTTGATPGGAA